MRPIFSLRSSSSLVYFNSRVHSPRCCFDRHNPHRQCRVRILHNPGSLKRQDGEGISAIRFCKMSRPDLNFETGMCILMRSESRTPQYLPVLKCKNTDCALDACGVEGYNGENHNHDEKNNAAKNWVAVFDKYGDKVTAVIQNKRENHRSTSESLLLTTHYSWSFRPGPGNRSQDCRIRNLHAHRYMRNSRHRPIRSPGRASQEYRKASWETILLRQFFKEQPKAVLVPSTSRGVHTRLAIVLIVAMTITNIFQVSFAIRVA